MSKGSRPRPISVSNQEYDQRWDAIFGKENPTSKNEEEVKAATDNIVQPVEDETKGK